MLAIVHDFGLEVNEYAKRGRQIPIYKPASCPACESPRLTSLGVRLRLAWLVGEAAAKELYVRRLECTARGGCGRCFTVLPSFLHPYRRYVVDEFQPVVEARFEQCLSFGKMERTLPSPPVASTQRAWTASFMAAAGVWLAELTGWFTRWNPEAVLARAVEESDTAGLIALAILSLDWMRSQQGAGPVERTRWLRELWSWGAVRCGPLFPPTRSRAGPRDGPGQPPDHAP